MKRNIESPNESCDSGVTETFAGTVSRGKQLNNGKWIQKIHCEKQIVGKVGWKKNAGVSELSSRCYLRQLFFFLAVSWRHSSFRVLRNMNEIPFISVAVNSILTLCWRPFGLWLNKYASFCPFSTSSPITLFHSHLAFFIGFIEGFFLEKWNVDAFANLGKKKKKFWKFD